MRTCRCILGGDDTTFGSYESPPSFALVNVERGVSFFSFMRTCRCILREDGTIFGSYDSPPSLELVNVEVTGLLEDCAMPSFISYGSAFSLANDEDADCFSAISPICSSSFPSFFSFSSSATLSTTRAFSFPSSIFSCFDISSSEIIFSSTKRVSFAILAFS